MWRQSENCGHINAHYYDSFRCFSVIKIRLLSYDQFHRNGLILTKSHLLMKGVGFPGEIRELVIRTCLPMQVDLRDTGWIPGREDPLEEGTATHSSVLAWTTPGTEETHGLRLLGSQRAGHD